jgi:hypothetical protein
MASIRSLAATAAFFGSVMASPHDKRAALPALAQVINQKSFNVLPTVPTPEEYNGSSVSADHNRPLGRDTANPTHRPPGFPPTSRLPGSWRSPSTCTMTSSSPSSAPTPPSP